jgi:hypothetical protein
MECNIVAAETPSEFGVTIDNSIPIVIRELVSSQLAPDEANRGWVAPLPIKDEQACSGKCPPRRFILMVLPALAISLSRSRR